MARRRARTSKAQRASNPGPAGPTMASPGSPRSKDARPNTPCHSAGDRWQSDRLTPGGLVGPCS
jgi:hypothetical protein